MIIYNYYLRFLYQILLRIALVYIYIYIYIYILFTKVETFKNLFFKNLWDIDSFDAQFCRETLKVYY